MKVGILLVTIGLIWLGARLGLLDFSWLQAVYIGPAVFILLGFWMVYKGFMQGNPRKIDDKTKEV
jgi:putative Mn2+ efflux pump MntP